MSLQLVRKAVLRIGFTLGLLASLMACNDRRAIEPAAQQLPAAPPPPRSAIQKVADVKFENKDTKVETMSPAKGSLFLTGYPFGFARWDITADPEAPRMTFSVSNQITSFAPTGRWAVEYHAGGALGIVGNLAFMSGSAGLSVADLTQVSNPVEVIRIPPVDPNTTGVAQDLAFVYKAVVGHPTLPMVYGFREQDFVYTLGITQAGISLDQRSSYAPNAAPVCCVRNAVLFQNRLFVAFTARLVWFDMQPNGALISPGERTDLQAQYVTASNGLLFVYHQPTPGQPQGAGKANGLYVFDAAGTNVDFIPLPFAPKTVAVNDKGTHLYMNVDDVSVQIFRILWANPAMAR